MARLLARKQKILVIIQEVVVMLQMIMVVCAAMYSYVYLSCEQRLESPNSAYRVYQQLSHLHGLVFESDIKCLSQLKMDRQAFFKLCKLLCEKGSLVRSKRVSPEEMVAMFLSILAHHVKNRVVGFNFKRSRRTVSKCFHECLRAMIRCQRNFGRNLSQLQTTQRTQNGSGLRMSQRGRGMSKHYWTTAQDDALVDSLYELSQNPMWGVDCGFRTGYLNQLESMLELKIPECGLKASPHIESRVKYFKLKHNAVADMLALSGFGWDSEKSMIVCDKSVYDEYVKKRKDASGLFLKPFPHYYTLSEIFGSDRANGANAGNADDDEEEVRHEDNFNFTLGNDSTHETFMENILDDMSHTPQSHAPANEN